MELPAHVVERLRDEFHCRMIAKAPTEGGAVDALYVTADQPHQLSLYAEPEIDYGLVVQKKTDAVYVTRFQKERWSDKERPYPKIDAKFLGEPQYADASVMHPLPRVNELDASFDSDRRAVYFRQAAYGVPVRMALISLLLNLNKNTSLHKFPGGFAKPEHPVYAPADRHRHRLRQSKLHHQRSNRTAIRRPQILRRGAAGGEAQQAALPLLRDRRRSASGRRHRRRRHRAADVFARRRDAPARLRRQAEKRRHLPKRGGRQGRRLCAARERQEGPRLDHTRLPP